MDAVHHPDMIACVTGNAEPLYGRAAHAAAMEQFFRIFPDVHVANDPYPIQCLVVARVHPGGQGRRPDR
jgi:SnoaL-like polyketide cyclase